MAKLANVLGAARPQCISDWSPDMYWTWRAVVTSEAASHLDVRFVARSMALFVAWVVSVGGISPNKFLFHPRHRGPDSLLRSGWHPRGVPVNHS